MFSAVISSLLHLLIIDHLLSKISGLLLNGFVDGLLSGGQGGLDFEHVLDMSSVFELHPEEKTVIGCARSLFESGIIMHHI